MIKKRFIFKMIPINDYKFIDRKRPTTYSPAIPVKVHIGDLIIQTHALIDTGADISLINKKLLGDLQGIEDVEIMSLSGTIQSSYHLLEVEIISPKDKSSYPLGPIKFIAIELLKGYEIILGREGVLDRFKSLTFDYPNKKFTIELEEKQIIKKEQAFLTEAKSLIDQGYYSAGITFIGMYIEEIILKLGEKHGISFKERKTKRSVLDSIKQLNKKKIISSSEYNVLISIWNIRNKAVHQGDKITNKEAIEALEYSERIYKTLQKNKQNSRKG